MARSRKNTRRTPPKPATPTPDAPPADLPSEPSLTPDPAAAPELAATGLDPAAPGPPDPARTVASPAPTTGSPQVPEAAVPASLDPARTVASPAPAPGSPEAAGAAAESAAATGDPVAGEATSPAPAPDGATGPPPVATGPGPSSAASSAESPETATSPEPTTEVADEAGAARTPEGPTPEVPAAADGAAPANGAADDSPADDGPAPATEPVETGAESSGSEPELSENAAVPKGPSRQRGLRSALATLPVPNPGPSFWADIDRAMAEQQPLSINARPAIRPITEPPPLSQPSLSDHFGSSAILVTDDRPAGTLDGYDNDNADVAPPEAQAQGYGRGSSTGPNRPLEPGPPLPKLIDPSKANTRRTVLVVVGVILVLLIVGNFIDSQGDDPSGAETAGTTVPSTTTTTARPTTTVPSVPGLDPNAALTPTGLGPLTIGTTLRDLNGAGARASVDQATFATSGGACYDAKLPGAPDLTLRFRSPDPDTGVADPLEGVLASIGITIAPGSPRVTETGVRLGFTEDQVRAAHPGSLAVNDHPTNPGGHLLLARQRGGTGLGFAYGTDGTTVTEILVGYNDAISQRQGCH